MLLPLHLAWKDIVGAVVYRGADWSQDQWRQADLVEGVLQPGAYSAVFTAVLQNPVQERRLEAVSRDGSSSGTPEKFVNVRLYLDADDPAMVALLLDQWPLAGAGIELSFDRGISWTRLSSAAGHPERPSTWILLPGSSVTEGAPDGELGPFPPFNRATIQMRVRTPAETGSFGLFRFRLVPDADVL